VALLVFKTSAPAMNRWAGSIPVRLRYGSDQGKRLVDHTHEPVRQSTQEPASSLSSSGTTALRWRHFPSRMFTTSRETTKFNAGRCHRTRSSNLQIVDAQLAGALIGLGGVAVGAGLTYLAEASAWRRTETLTTRLQLAGTGALIWADTTQFHVLTAHLAQLRARLSTLNVPPDLVRRHEESTLACWRYSRNSLDTSDDASISTSLLRERESIADDLDFLLARTAASRFRRSH
jgi:hypothetical protein